METWPVTECCIPHLQQILDTHDLYPLPAYNIKGQLIPPLQYDALLKGATVEAHFTLIHHYIKSMNQHVCIHYNGPQNSGIMFPCSIANKSFQVPQVRTTNDKGKQQQI